MKYDCDLTVSRNNSVKWEVLRSLGICKGEVFILYVA